MPDKRLRLSIAATIILIFVLALPPASSGSTETSDWGQSAASLARMLRDGEWSGTLHVFRTPGRSRSPVMVSASDGLHAVWEEQGGLLFHSRGDGETWSEPAAIQVGDYPLVADHPAMAVDSHGRPHLVCVEQFEEKLQVFHSVWNGEGWELPQRVRETTGQSGPPDIAIALAVGTQIHVVWADYRDGESLIYCAESTDGKNWSDTSWILPRPTGSVPAVAVRDDGGVHVAWQDESNSADGLNDIYYCARPPGGDWSQLIENVSHSPLIDSLRSDLVLDADGQVHLVWEEAAEGSAQVYYARGRSGNWSAPIPLSETPSDAPLPCIATDGHDLFVAWQSGTELL